MRHGGQILVDQLKIQGVERVFCVPGESYLAALDGLRGGWRMGPPGGPKGRRAATSAPQRASPSAPPGRTPPPSVALVAPPGSAAACASADAARAPCHRQGAFARRAHRAGGRRPARMAETRGLSPVAGLS